MNLAAQPQLPDPETLRQLPNEQLVSIIMQQQQVISSKAIEELTQAVNQLKVSQGLDSQTSKPPRQTY